MKIGADVEFFLQDSGDNLVSAIGRIPGTKEKKHILESGAGLHVDNVSLEIAFEPFRTFEDFNSHIDNSLYEVEEMIKPLYLSNKASGVFPDSELDHPDAWLFGCDPDFNAWTGDINNIIPECDPRMRSNGGHVHIGCDALLNRDIHRIFIQNLDKSLGIWSLKKDKDTERRKLYGQAGAHRPKPYGIEYRVLSNFWIFDKKLRKKVWNTCQQVVSSLKNNELKIVNPNI